MKRVLLAFLICFITHLCSCTSDTNNKRTFEKILLNTNFKKFVIVITSFNNEAWYRYNLESALTQKYPYYRIIYVNDASTDATYDLVVKFLAEHDPHKKVTLINNHKRLGACANFYSTINFCEPDEIVVILDGDDWLAHDNVLDILNSVYQDPQVWITYGQFKHYPIARPGASSPLPRIVIAQNAYREYAWVTSHLRTFYAFLFHQIEKEDLMYEGDFFPMAPDLAIMFPILEMGGKHSKFIPDILYVYNTATSLNENKIDHMLQKHIDLTIRKLKKYRPLD